jgi:hypothetical protein
VATPREITSIFDAGVNTRSIQRDLKYLQEAQLIHADGKGRGVRYRIYDGD